MKHETRIFITLNHKPMEIESGMTISEFLVLAGYPKSVAVFVNKTPLMMKAYGSYIIKEADAVVVFRPLGGG